MELKDIISSGILEIYTLGAASPEEAAQVEAWSVQYPEVRQEIEHLQDAMESYAMANAVSPDPSLRTKIMDHIAKDVIADAHSTPAPAVYSDAFSIPGEAEAPVVNISSSLKWIAAASFFLLLGSLVLNYILYDKYNRVNKDLTASRTRLDNIQQQSQAMQQDMSVMTNKYAEAVSLNGTTHAPDAAAKIFWMKNSGEVYVDASFLPEAPQGKQYQLWAIVDGKPVDAGMITKDGKQYRMQKMKSFGKAQAFAITLEKQGGSPTPTMEEMVVMSKS